MEITRCEPAGKPKGWYDATGTRYLHPDEIIEAMKYPCHQHGCRASSKESGCPVCVSDARRAIRGALAALSQNKTFPADVEVARTILSGALGA